MLKRNLTSELVKKFNEYITKIDTYIYDNNYKEALNCIDEAFKDLFRLSSKFFNSFSDENLIDMIKTDGSINTDKCIMMSKLLEEEALIFEKQNNLDESFYLNLKALNLFLEAYFNQNTECDLENYFEDIENILNKVSDYKLPTNLNYKIMDYHIKTNNYDNAEDTLYETLKENKFNEVSLRKGIEFYETLLLKTDEELENGNLPKNEILDSLDTLKNKLN